MASRGQTFLPLPSLLTVKEEHVDTATKDPEGPLLDRWPQLLSLSPDLQTCRKKAPRGKGLLPLVEK